MDGGGVWATRLPEPIADIVALLSDFGCTFEPGTFGPTVVPATGVIWVFGGRFGGFI